MPTVTIPFEKRLMFGHDYWRSHRAIDEIEIYCDLLKTLEQRIATLENRGRGEEATLVNVEAVISSYAFEIGMKSLWALDNPKGVVKGLGHNLAKLYEGLKPDTTKSLKLLGLTREELKEFPTPFATNRYSMEKGKRDIGVYRSCFLKALTQLLRDKLQDSRKAAFTSSRLSQSRGESK